MSENKHPYDEALLKILHNHDSPYQELNFLNTVFGFLNRHTKYLSNPSATKSVTNLVHTYIDKAKEREIEQRTQPNQTKLESNIKEEEKENKLNDNSSSNTNNNNDDSKIANDAQLKDVSTKEKEKNEITNHNNIKPPDPNAPNVTVEEPYEGPRPVGNGGTTDKYVWTQTLNELEVKLQVPIALRGKDINVNFHSKKLKIYIKGKEKEPLLEGELHEEIKVDDSSWTLDKEFSQQDTKTLTLILPKKKGMTWWKCVLKGDPEINVKHIEPENSKLQDLDPETRQTVEKMMFDQRQKMMGQPTAKELEQRDILKKFQAQHPEMDFSNVKFG